MQLLRFRKTLIGPLTVKKIFMLRIRYIESKQIAKGLTLSPSKTFFSRPEIPYKIVRRNSEIFKYARHHFPTSLSN